MWILGKSKKQERLAELKKIQVKYNKIIAIIRSCTNIHHMDCCITIINNFEHYCQCKGLPHPTCVIHLRSYAKLKRRSIWLT